MTATDTSAHFSFSPPDSAKFLLLQMRSREDEMRPHEVRCFSRALGVEIQQTVPFDLLNESLSPSTIRSFDMVLLGGAGEFSATSQESWIERPLDSLREVHDAGLPTFASCWGFQAMARALGGKVINDTSNAEVGTLPIHLTAGGGADELFGQLPPVFDAPMGHEDHVVELPPGCVHLAHSKRVPMQAYRCGDKPIYCTQFHPELNADDLVKRVKAYPEYLERIAGVTLDEFVASIHDTPVSGTLLQRFGQLVFG